MIKLSIIIPCYNAEPYVYELLDTLAPQMTEETEVVLIDDGSKKPVKSDYSWVKIVRQKNGGISKARNKGLNLTSGLYVWFIDADDLISDYAISYILSKIDSQDFDYMDLSWKSLEDNRYTFKLNSDNDSLPNPSASTRVFKRSFIGDVRFNENKDAAEDEDFTRHIGIKNAKHICATEILYYYRITTPGSNYKRYLDGITKTKRIGYYFNHVTRDMEYLIDEIKELDKEHEVFLLTRRNDLPELEKYCQVRTPQHVRVYEKRGESNNYLEALPRPIETQIVIYTSQTTLISGIATFTYSFCKHMSKYYDITIVYDSIPSEQLSRLASVVMCIKNNVEQPITCDTLIMNSILDKRPANIKYRKSVQMVHCIKQADYKIPQDRDYIVNVSQASKDSFGDEAKDGTVIHNLIDTSKTAKTLFLVSAFRVAKDKQSNDKRCIQLAQMLDRAGISYIWLYFSDIPLKNAPVNMIHCGFRKDIRPFIAKADYLVLLSGAEAFSYSLLEALVQKTPVIVTPLAQNEDMGIVDGVNGYVVPFDVETFDVKKLLNIPKFNYSYDNMKIIKQWRNLLGDSKPKGDYKPAENVAVCVSREYKDLQLGELLTVGEVRNMPYGRALELVSKGFVRIIL